MIYQSVVYDSYQRIRLLFCGSVPVYMTPRLIFSSLPFTFPKKPFTFSLYTCMLLLRSKMIPPDMIRALPETYNHEKHYFYFQNDDDCIVLCHSVTRTCVLSRIPEKCVKKMKNCRKPFLLVCGSRCMPVFSWYIPSENDPRLLPPAVPPESPRRPETVLCACLRQ